MTLFWRCGYSMVLLLLLAGCFQQAGESLQSAGSTAVPDQSSATTEIILSTDIPTQESAQVEDASPTIQVTRPPSTGPTTPTMPPITIIFQPTETIRPTQPSVQSSEGETSVGFITPGSPLGPGLDDGDLPTVSSDTVVVATSDTVTTSDEPALPEGVDPECSYIIESGDTVFGIALSFDTTVAELQEINPELEGDNPVIQPGQIVILPECNNIPSEETEEPEIVEATGTSTRVPSIIEPVVPGTTATAAAGGGSGETYIVQRGDTLFIIAQRYGTTVAALVAANNLSNPDRLSVGQQLIIPPRP